MMPEKKCPKQLHVVLVGEGGQGIQTVAKVISRSAFENGYHSAYIPNFGTEQRGGLSLAFIQVSCDPIVSPKFKTADIYVIVSDRDIHRTLRYIGKDTSVFYDKTLVSKATINKIKKLTSHIAPAPLFEKATKQLTERSLNIILLGILTTIVDLDMKQKIIEIMDKKFDKYYKKNKKLKEFNHMALEIGIKLAQSDR